MTGYVKVHRALFDHPMFAGDELCPGHAWAWLIAHAAWKPTRARIGPQTVELQRGELSFSVRFLAQKWGWSKSRVARFLARLASEGMIKNRDSSGTVCGTQSGTGQGIISICNYERYQDGEPDSGTGSGTPRETKAGQKRDKEEEGKKEEEDILHNATTRVRAEIVAIPGGRVRDLDALVNDLSDMCTRANGGNLPTGWVGAEVGILVGRWIDGLGLTPGEVVMVAEKQIAHWGRAPYGPKTWDSAMAKYAAAKAAPAPEAAQPVRRPGQQVDVRKIFENLEKEGKI